MSDIYGIQPDQFESIVNQIKKASDSYAKMDIFDEFDVDWGDRKPALWELIRQGHYDAWNDPAIWGELAESIELASAEDLVNFLAKVERFDAEAAASSDTDDSGDDGYDDYDDEYYEDEYYDDYDGYGGYEEPPFESQRLVSFWPVDLDVMAMNAYAQDAELVESRAGEFTEDVQQGLQLVRRRFGKIEADALPEGFVAELAKTHVWNSLPWYAWDVVDGELQRLEIGRHDGDGPELQAKWLANFVSQEDWGKAILEAIFLEDYGPGFQSSMPAWQYADTDQLAHLISEISIYNQDRVKAYELVLARDDSPADLLNVAKKLDKDSRWHQAEFAAIASVLRAKALGESASDEALQLISFRSLDNPYRRSEYFSLPMLTEALHQFDEDAVVNRFIEVFDGEYTKSEPFPAVSAYPNNKKLLEKAIQTVDVVASGEYANFSGMNKPSFGLGLLGTSALQLLADAHDAAELPLAKDAFRRAILGILADADAPQDEAYDRFISLVDFADTTKTRDHDLGHYVGDDYRAALDKLPGDRAALRVAADLEASKANWHRALGALKTIHNPELLDKAFGMLASQGLPKSDGFDWFGQLLYDYDLRPTFEPFIGPALAASSNAEFHNAIKNQFGEEKYDEMLANAGGQSVADKTPADKVRRLANELFESRENLERTVVYIFNRTEEPAGDSMNRLGGRPFGVTAETWPKKDDDADLPMEHIFTLDLKTVPALKARFQDDVRAISLFLRSPGNNQAYGPGNSWSEVSIVTEDDAVEFAGDLLTGSAEGVKFTVDEVEVPMAAWDVEYGTDKEMEAMRSAIYQLNAWVGGGGPIWLQGADHWSVPVMQLDESFSWGLNLGDMGIMYVFVDTAFWQCH